jgi:hypothetical protein
MIDSGGLLFKSDTFVLPLPRSTSSPANSAIQERLNFITISHFDSSAVLGAKSFTGSNVREKEREISWVMFI